MSPASSPCYSDGRGRKCRAAAPSQAARQRALGRVAEALAADVVLVPLYRFLDRYAFAAGLEFAPRMDRRIRAQDMRWASPPSGARLP